MNSWLLPPETLTFLISMLPISELRGALPYGLSQGLSPWKAYSISVAGNMVPVLPLLLGLKGISALARRWTKGEKLLDWTIGRAERRQDLVKKYGFGGLVLLVAIPLPVTGAWTGTLVSFLLSIEAKYAFLAICIGVGLAGIIVLLASLGVIGLVGFKI